MAAKTILVLNAKQDRRRNSVYLYDALAKRWDRELFVGDGYDVIGRAYSSVQNNMGKFEGAGASRQLLQKYGFNSEHYPLPDAPVHGGNYMFVANK